MKAMSKKHKIVAREVTIGWPEEMRRTVPGYVLDDGILLLEREKNAHGNYIGCTGMDGMLTETSRLFYPVKENDEIIAFEEIREPEQSRSGTLSEQQQKYFKGSKVRDAAGNLYPVYHGSGTRITQFLPDYTGRGQDQYGSGFYFTTSKEEAEGYTTAQLPGQAGEKLDKPGGMDAPNIVTTYIRIENPIIVNGNENGNLSHITLSGAQSYEILRRLPTLYNSLEDETTSNPLGDHFEEMWEESFESSEDYEPYIKRLAHEYYDDVDMRKLDILFADYPTEFRNALRDVLGYDGIIVNFEDRTHVIVWFPEQVKDIQNLSPKETPYLMDEAQEVSESPEKEVAIAVNQNSTPAKPRRESSYRYESKRVTWLDDEIIVEYFDDMSLRDIYSASGNMDVVADYLKNNQIPAPTLAGQTEFEAEAYALAAEIDAFAEDVDPFGVIDSEETPEERIAEVVKSILKRQTGPMREYLYGFEDEPRALALADRLRALTGENIASSKKTIYVCSPLAGQIQQNIQNARQYSKFVAKQGAVPVAPHITELFDDSLPEERTMGLEYGIDLLKKADELWVFGNTISNGMQAEIEYATEHSISIYQVDTITFSIEPYIRPEKVIDGYKVIAESRTMAFGYSAEKEPHLQLWTIHDGTYSEYGNADYYTVNYYGLLQNAHGLDTDKVWQRLDDAGYHDYIYTKDQTHLEAAACAKAEHDVRVLHAQLLAQAPEEILENAYHYATLQDISIKVQAQISSEQMEPPQLEHIARSGITGYYNEWLRSDYSSIDNLLENTNLHEMHTHVPAMDEYEPVF